jgi:MYXO-CTERM domain-containing protein
MRTSSAPARLGLFPLGSALVISLATSTPAVLAAQDCPPDAVGCHRADIDFDYLDMRLPSVSLDSGWVPASSPIQVRFALFFMGETEVELGGTLATYWPFGLSMATPGRAGQGRLRMAWGLEIVARMRFSADIAGTHYEWEGDIPFVPFRDLRLVDEVMFDPFVLPGAMPRPVSVHDTTEMVNVFEVGLSSIIGASIPGLDGGFAVSLTGDLTTSYQTDRILIEDARGPIDREGAVVQYWPPPDGFGGSEDVVVRPEGTIAYEGDIVVRPNVFVELLGRRFDLVGIDIPVPIVRTTTPTMFDPDTVHVPLPDVTVSPTNLDGGTLIVGDVATESLTIRNRGEAELVVTVDALPDTLMVSSARVTVPASSEATLGVTIAPSMEGMLSETLTLRTNDPDQPLVRVPVTAEAIELDAGPNDAGRRDASVVAADAGPDAGSRAAGLTGGACGCSVPGPSDRGAPLGVMAALAALLAARRRRSA